MGKDSTTTISVSDWDPRSEITSDLGTTITIDTEAIYDVNVDWLDQDIQLDLELDKLDDKFPVHIANKLKEALEEVDKDLEKDDDLPF